MQMGKSLGPCPLQAWDYLHGPFWSLKPVGDSFSEMGLLCTEPGLSSLGVREAPHWPSRLPCQREDILFTLLTRYIKGCSRDASHPSVDPSHKERLRAAASERIWRGYSPIQYPGQAQWERALTMDVNGLSLICCLTVVY